MNALRNVFSLYYRTQDPTTLSSSFLSLSTLVWKTFFSWLLHYIPWLFTEVQLRCAKLFSHNVTKSICPLHTIEHESLADALSKSGCHSAFFLSCRFLRDFCTCSFNFWQLENKHTFFPAIDFKQFCKDLVPSFCIQRTVTLKLAVLFS